MNKAYESEREIWTLLRTLEYWSFFPHCAKQSDVRNNVFSIFNRIWFACKNEGTSTKRSHSVISLSLSVNLTLPLPLPLWPAVRLWYKSHSQCWKMDSVPITILIIHGMLWSHLFQALANNTTLSTLTYLTYNLSNCISVWGRLWVVYGAHQFLMQLLISVIRSFFFQSV